jgi:hypothetical protein
MVQAVLDALSAPEGGGDLRTRPQRYHDALEEAMRWLRFCIMIGPIDDTQADSAPHAQTVKLTAHTRRSEHGMITRL